MSSSIKSARTLGLAGLMAVVATAVVASMGAPAAMAETKCSEQGVAPPCYVLPAGKAKVAFTSTTTGVKRLWGTLFGFKAEVECTGTANHKSAEDSGEITGPRSDTDTIKFYGCKEVEPFRGACHSIKPAGNAEEIVTNLLASKPVWLKSGTRPVGIELIPASGNEYTEFDCPGLFGEETIKVTESILGELPELNAKGENQYNSTRNNAELKFECEPAKSTKQKYQTYWETVSGKLVETKGIFLKANGNEACEEESAADTLTFAEPVEVKTT